ncbi:MAG: hypothetical protein ACLP8Y_09565 [Thermoplasmata archaeon]
MFAKLCTTAQFISIYENTGPSGFFVIGWGGSIGTQPNLSFTLYWQATCVNASDGLGNSQCMHQADWIGNLTDNSVTGPFVREYALICMCGPVFVPGPQVAAPAPWFVPGIMGASLVVATILALATRRRRLPPTPSTPESSG